MLKIKKFGVSLRTVYAQAKELGARPEGGAGPDGGQPPDGGAGRGAVRVPLSLQRERQADHRVSGPESNAETAAKVEQAKEEIEDQAAIADYSQKLRRIGFYSSDNSTVVTVASLFNAGVFGGGGVLIGTHAFGVIINELGVSASPFPMTEAVDVARAERIELAALPEGGFLDLLKQTGLPFHEVPTLKRGAPSTSFKVRGRSLKVDLLIPARGKPYTSVKVPELGAHAMGLPYLEYLLKATISSVLIGRDRIVPVTIPHPGWFCLHKLALYAVARGRRQCEAREGRIPGCGTGVSSRPGPGFSPDRSDRENGQQAAIQAQSGSPARAGVAETRSS